LAFIAEGSRVSSVARVKGHKEDTILDWLRGAAQQESLVPHHQGEVAWVEPVTHVKPARGERRAIFRLAGML
jgi:hypothetical protein